MIVQQEKTTVQQGKTILQRGEMTVQHCTAIFPRVFVKKTEGRCLSFRLNPQLAA